MLLISLCGCTSVMADPPSNTPAKNIIFFLGDGMGPTTVTASRIYAVGEAGKLTIDRLKHSARIKTYSEDAQTTDSAPSMGAYMTGLKNKNDVISMPTGTLAKEPKDLKLANGQSIHNAINLCQPRIPEQTVPSLLELAIQRGKAVGVVTTAELTHATPAATYAHICHRDAKFDIAVQAVPNGLGYNPKLKEGIHVLMGGGRNHWTPYHAINNPQGRADQRHLIQEMQTQKYQYVETASALQQANPNQKILGLFSATSHLHYDLDRINKNIVEQPSLSEMTLKSIQMLEAQSKGRGWFLMVESGRIDHALHANNAKRALHETKAFDDAIHAAIQQVDLSNTLIVVTADHDHVMTFNGYNALTGKTTPNQPGILGLNYHYKITTQPDALAKKMADGKLHAPSLDVNGNTNTVLVFGNGKRQRENIQQSVTESQVFDDNYQQVVGVQLNRSETHGGGDVMLFADGKNAHLFKGTQDNTWVFQQIIKALGFTDHE